MLSDIKENQRATITEIPHDSSVTRRLLDMGFMPGQNIICTNIAVFGTPAAYELRGCKIALRKKDAERIGVIL